MREAENAAGMLKSYLSYLPNDFWEMKSPYSSLWPSVSFVYRLLSTKPGPHQDHKSGVCMRTQGVPKLGDIMRQCCPRWSLLDENHGFRLGMNMCVYVCLHVDVGGLQL